MKASEVSIGDEVCITPLIHAKGGAPHVFVKVIDKVGEDLLIVLPHGQVFVRAADCFPVASVERN